MANKQFGRDPLKVGMLTELRDLTAQDQHRSPEHMPTRVRTVEVGDDGYIRVGVAFKGSSGWPDSQVDAEGYALDVGCWCFPHQLRAV